MEQKHDEYLAIQLPKQNSSNTTGSAKPTENLSTLTNSFFQVSVSSQKLSNIFQRITQSFELQTKRMEQMQKQLKNLSQNFWERFEKESRKSGEIFAKLELKIHDCANSQHKYSTEVSKKSEARDQELERRIEATNVQILKLEKNINQVVYRQSHRLRKEIMGDDVVVISKDPLDYDSSNEDGRGNGKVQTKENNVVSKKDLEIIQKKIVSFHELFRHFEDEMHRIEDLFQPKFDKLFKIKEQKQRQQEAERQKRQLIVQTYRNQAMNACSFKPNSTFSSSSNRQNSPAPANSTVNPQTNSNPISSSANKQTFNNSPLKRSIIRNNQNQMSYNQDMRQSLIRTGRNVSLSRSSGFESEVLKSCYVELVDKMEKLDTLFVDQVHRISQIKNKQIIIDEKVNIYIRRLQKNNMQIAQLKTAIRRCENQKQDQKSIQQLRHQIKWVTRDLEDKLVQKCTTEEMMAQKAKLIEKISILHENLISKADKSEIQKAFNFLETKIKQIILLIAAEQTQEKDGAITKLVAKCLSCDKEIERQQLLQQQQQQQQQLRCRRQLNINIPKQNQAEYIKSMTNRVRQRYRKDHAKTLGNENETFHQ